MKTKFTLLLLLLSFIPSWAQTLFSENMGTPSETISIASNTFSNISTLSYSSGGQANSADVRITSASNGYTNSSGTGNVYFSSTSGAYGFSIEGINASNYSALSIQFGYKKEAAASHATFSVDYWNGSSWTTLANSPSTLFNEGSGASAVWYLSKSLAIPADAQISGLKLRFVKTGTIAIRIDDVKLTGTENVPSVTNTTATSITSDSATFAGNVTATGGASITATGTVYSVTATTANPVIGGSGVNTISTPSPNAGTGTFSNGSGAVLSPNVQYSYNAYATKSTGASGYGTAATFYTLAVTPTAPTVGSPSGSTLNIAIGTDANPSSTTYAVLETTTGHYVQANGTLGATAVYQTASVWGTKTVTGLSATTTYTFEAVAKNGAGITTASGPSANGTTLTPNNNSDIVFNASSSTSSNSNLSYELYQGTTLTNTGSGSGGSIGVMGFYLRDGGAGLNDADNLGTQLSAISFTINHWENIRSARLFQGNSPKGAVVSVTGSTITFSGITDITAADNAQLALSLRVTFNSVATDNDQMQFTITSVTADSTGSQFALSNAGGAASSLSGDVNRVEITASKLGFNQQPPTSLYAGTSITPAVAAMDGLENVDLDFTGMITLTSSGLLGPPQDASAIAGVATFTFNIFDFSASGTGFVLTASSSGLLTANSSLFDVSASPEIVLANLPPVTCQINNCNLVVNGDFEELSGTPGYAGQIQNACGWYPAAWTPDLFSTLSPPEVSIPCNFRGGQTCNNGLGSNYAGINFSGQLGEIMVSRLSTPLVAGQNYQLSFDVSLAEAMSSFTSTIQAYLSPTTIPITPGSPIAISNPAMLFSRTTTSTISNGWETLTFTFTSTGGGEEYIYLGGFQNVITQPNTTTTDPACVYSNDYNSSAFVFYQYSYYYIDNIQLVPTNNSIDALNDDFSLSPIGTLSGGITPSVLTNDTVSGVAATSSNVVTSLISVTPPMSPMPTINANGIITIPAGVAIGTYTIVYEIANPCNNNFDTASVGVVIGALSITNCLKVYLDELCYHTSQAQTTLSTIFTAGCEPALIDGLPCNSTNVTIELLTPLETGCTFNPDGTITIAAGTMPFIGQSFYILRSVANPSVTSAPLRVNYGISQKVNTNFTEIWLHAGSPPIDVYDESVNILNTPLISTINPNTNGSCGLINTLIGQSFTSNTVTIVETTNPQNPYYRINPLNGFVQFRPPYDSSNAPPEPSPLTYYGLTYTMCINNTGATTFCNDGLVVIHYYYDDHKVNESIINNNDMAVYPNPSADGRFTLLFYNEVKDGTVEVYNLLGQKIKQDRILNASEQLLDLSTTAKGTYLLRIQDDEKQVVKKLIVK